MFLFKRSYNVDENEPILNIPNINSNYVLIHIVNFITEAFKDNVGKLKKEKLFLILNLTKVSKQWATSIIPYVKYGEFDILNERDLQVFIRLKTVGYFKTPIYSLKHVYMTFTNEILQTFSVNNPTKTVNPLLWISTILYTSISQYTKEEIESKGSEIFNIESLTIDQFSNTKLNLTEIKSFLCKFSSISKLTIKNSTYEMMSNVILDKLASNYSNLSTLEIPYMKLGGKEIISVLESLTNADLKNLTSLNLVGNNIGQEYGAEVGEFISKAPLQFINLSFNHLKNSISDICNSILNGDINFHLLEFKIAENYIDNVESLESICKLITNNKTITSLDINSNVFNDNLTDLFLSLKQNPTVKKLNISNCSPKLPISEYFSNIVGNLNYLNCSSNVISDSDEYFFKYFTKKGSLNFEYLDFSYSKIFSKTLEHFNTFIFVSNISILNLSLCKLSESNSTECENLIRLIFTKQSIVDLNLSLNGLHDKYGVIIAKLLKTNSSIVKLNLANNIFYKSSNKIFESLTMNENSSISNLNLCHNNIVTIDNSLYNFISKNQQIRYLNLSFNNFNDEQGGELFKSLPNNNSLVSIHLTNNNFAEITCESINVNYKKFPSSLSHIFVNLKRKANPNPQLILKYKGIDTI